MSESVCTKQLLMPTIVYIKIKGVVSAVCHSVEDAEQSAKKALTPPGMNRPLICAPFLGTIRVMGVMTPLSIRKDSLITALCTHGSLLLQRDGGRQGCHAP